MEKVFATVAVGSDEERKIEVKDTVFMEYVDGRTIVIQELVDNQGIVIQTLNEKSTGRSNQILWLSEKSTITMLNTLLVFFKLKESPLTEMLAAMNEKEVIIAYSTLVA